MRYRHVVCIYPFKEELKTMGFLPPIGLEYVASAIEGLVESISVIDLRYEKAPATSFIDGRTDLVLMSINWGVERDFVKSVINSIPEGITVVVGGRHATEYVDELFADIPRIDGIVRGDGEEIARDIVHKGLSQDIDGLSFRKDGKVVHNKNRTLSPVRSDFFPKRKLRRYDYRITIDEFNTGIGIDLMLASRGCPFNCQFCDFNFNPLGEKRKWSARTPESVVAELKTIGAGVVGFADDNFTADMNWVGRVCDLILKEGIRKKYAVNARIEIAKRPDVLEKMYKAGFMVFLMGVESAQDKTLASMKKGFTIAKIREYFNVLRRFNFVYHCYFIIGNIGETREEMLDVVDFSHELGVDTLGLSVLRATKYSPIREMLKTLDHYHIDDTGKVYSDALSVGELQQIRRDVNNSFFSASVILRLLKKIVIHRLLTLTLVFKIAAYTARRKSRKIAAKRGIRMGKVVR
jgi:anaerobic magnesium-protoporphyrin IX monomethyl ester cyclase